MHALLVVVLAAVPVETFASHEEAATALVGRVETGTLLFSEGDCLAVKVFTGSPYTHVAAVVADQGGPWVYDSQNGVGVRKLALAEYLSATRPDELHLLNPAEPFGEERAEHFKAHLESQLGRPYSVKHHLTGRRCDGLHCAEYVTDSLAAADLIEADRPPRVSPASLRSGLLRYELYAEAGVVRVEAAEQRRAPGRSWCHELWLDTKDCCASCWGGFRRCVLCR
jgi:hypothetical protein